MGIVSRETAAPVMGLATGALPDAIPQQEPDTGSIFGAAFRQGNILGSSIEAFKNFAGTTNDFDPAYSAWDDIKGTPYEQHWQAFAPSNNRRYTEALKSQIDTEERDRRTLSAGGWTSTFAQLGAGLTDPTILIPVGGEVAKGIEGYRILRAGARTALAGGLATAAQETGLQFTQAERPLSESATNVGFGTVLSAILGSGAAALLSKPERQAAQKGFNKLLDGYAQPANSSAGAAQASKSLGLEALTVDGGAASQIAEKTQFLNPGLRLNFSPSPVARQVGQELAEGSVYQVGHAEGLTTGPAVERLAGMTERARTADGLTRLNQAYSDMGRAGVNMSFDDFDQAVGRAMRNEDAGENEFISRAAKDMRSTIVDPFFEDGKAVGLYDDTDKVAFAPSYFPRQYKTKALIAREPEIKAQWIDYMKGHIQGRYANAAEDLRGHVAELDRKIAQGEGDAAALKAERDQVQRAFLDQWEIKHLGEGVDPLKPSAAPDFGNMARLIVDDVYDKLTGRDYGASSGVAPEYMIPIERGPVKERTLPIPDSLLTQQGVLEDRASDVLRRYARVLSADVELTKRFGSPRLDDQLKSLADDYAALREGVTDPKELTKLGARQRADQRDIEALRDLIRGTYKREANSNGWARVSRVAGQFNFIRSLGGVVISSLSDIARPIMVHGLSRYMGEGVGGLIRNMEAVKMSVAEAKLAGTVVDRVLQHRTMALSGLGDPFERGTAFERSMESMSRFASKWTGLPIWNDSMKAISSILSQNRILSGEADRRTLAFLGIDPAMEDVIRAEFKAHGEVLDGVHVAHTEHWTDQEAIRAFRAAVGKDVDSTIVTPGHADAPLLSHTPTGRLLLQFRSYTLASHQKVLLRGLQEGKGKFVSGMIGMTALGMLSATLKAWRAGENRWEKFKKAADNPGYLIGEGIDNAGTFALMFDAANTTEKLGQAMHFSFNPIKTPMMAAGSWAYPNASKQGESIRYSTRGPLGALLGPSAGLTEDIFAAGAGASDKIRGKKVPKFEQNAAFRLLPFNSFYGMREGIQAITGDSPYLQDDAVPLIPVEQRASEQRPASTDAM
jgi:hypothetical protein